MHGDHEFSHASEHDLQRAECIRRREADWRIGPVVYQVLVDRFAPPGDDLPRRRQHYAPPRRLRPWDELPTRGRYLKQQQVWSHELDFWGGDLAGLSARLEHIARLGAQVLYLNPIHQALTNHKYDAQDYFTVSTEYGSRQDLRKLAEALHRRQMRLVLDGVFNHMGRRAPWFRDALADEASPRRDWFFMGPQHRGGVLRWHDVDNLPALRLEHPQVQQRIFAGEDSVVRSYLKQDGVDGWRLDVAYDMGPAILRALTSAAHQARPGSLVVGEIWNYPEQWFPAVDGVINFFARQLILHLMQGRMSGAQAGRLLQRMVEDAGTEPLLRSWLFLDNHDTARLPNLLPAQWQRRLAQLLQFTLPGAPGIYYGSELGQKGGRDPANRAPMRWDLVSADNPELQWTRWLCELRSSRPALRLGDFRLLDSEQLLAFMRVTHRVDQTVLVLVNPSGAPVAEVLAVRDSKIPNRAALLPLRPGGKVQPVTVDAGLIHVQLPARSWMLLVPQLPRGGGYDPYARVL